MFSNSVSYFLLFQTALFLVNLEDVLCTGEVDVVLVAHVLQSIIQNVDFEDNNASDFIV